MKKTNKPLNLGVAIIHEMDGVSYKISGRLIDINESTSTCTIRFKNGRVENNIDMSKVYIAEGLVDTIKKYGKKFTSWIIEKVNGFVAFVNDLGEKCMWNPINMLIAYDREQPAGVYIAPGDSLVSAAEEAGVSVSSMSVDEAFLESENQEIDRVVKYWTRVMNRVGTTDESVKESVKWVNEKYYNVKPDSKPINEVVYSLDGVQDEVGNNVYGEVVHTEELKGKIKQNIIRQLALDKKYRASRIAAKRGVSVDDIQTELESATDVRPLLIWGAPGIGKTAIVKQVLKDLRESKYHSNLNIIEVNCSSIDKSSFLLPDRAEKNDVVTAFNMCPLKWLPFYVPGSAKQNAQAEEYFAKCRHLVKEANDIKNVNIEYDENEDYTGGVIFLDEIARVYDEYAAPGVANVIMGLVDGNLLQLKKAKSWCFIAASNRHFDDEHINPEAISSEAQNRRWIHVTFVPTKDEWIAWAESVDKKEGSLTKGLSRIPKVITQFIKDSDDGVFYCAVTLGAFNKEIEWYNKTSGNTDAKDADIMRGDVAGFQLFNDTIARSEKIGKNVITWNPAIWHEVSNEYVDQIQALLDDVEDGYTFDDLRMKAIENGDTDISPALLIPALEKVDSDVWADFIRTNLNNNKEKIKHKSGVQRMQDLYDYLISISGLRFGSRDAYPVKKMENYFQWTSIFDDRVCNSIFATGYMPQPEAKTDDLHYDDGGYSWKSNFPLITRVIEYILTKYPDNQGKADFVDYINNVAPSVANCSGAINTLAFKKNTSTNAAQIEKIISNAFDLSIPYDEKKLYEFFTVHTNTEQFGDVLVLDLDKYSSIGKQVLYNIIFGNSFCFNIINYVKYLCKISYSIGGAAHFLEPLTIQDDKKNFYNLVTTTYNIKSDQNLVRQYTTMHDALCDIRNKNKTGGYVEIDNLADCVDIFTLSKYIMSGVINSYGKSVVRGSKRKK